MASERWLIMVKRESRVNLIIVIIIYKVKLYESRLNCSLLSAFSFTFAPLSSPNFFSPKAITLIISVSGLCMKLYLG